MANTTSSSRSGGSRHPLATIAKLPWTLVIIAFLLVTTLTDIRMDGVTGYVFLGVGLFVLFVEFLKSGDISTNAFLIDLLVSVGSVACTASLLTLLFIDERYSVNFFHFYGAAIVLLDAILSPYNSFRTAKRNFEMDRSSDG
jgi:hypothetical protein